MQAIEEEIESNPLDTGHEDDHALESEAEPGVSAPNSASQFVQTVGNESVLELALQFSVSASVEIAGQARQLMSNVPQPTSDTQEVGSHTMVIPDMCRSCVTSCATST
jgi:hypothetical protein